MVMSDPKQNSEAAAQDYPLSEVPKEARKGFYSMATVLLGFTFFTSTMFAGGELGTAYKFWPDLMYIILIGNLLLGIYVAILGYIAYKTGYSTVVLARYSFGDWGSKWVDLVFSLTQIGWYAWGTATAAIVMVKLLSLPDVLLIPLMIFFGFFFCWTSYVGFRGLEILANIAVPAMVILIVWSFIIGLGDIGGFEGLQTIAPTKEMSFATALTIVFGTFVSGGTQSPNWSRFSKTAGIAIGASLMAFFIGNGLMVFAGAFGGYCYQQPDIVEVLKLQGLWLPALIMLILNIWTTQGNAIYASSVALCNLTRTEKRKEFNLLGAGIATILAIAGMYNWIIPYIIILSTVIPPIGGVIMADFFYKNRRNYPKIETIEPMRWNYVGIGAYIMGIIIAQFVPGVAPINGILGAFISYIILDQLAKITGFNQHYEISN